MNKKIFIAMLAFVFVGMTNVMAGTSKDEKAEVSSVNEATASGYYLELYAQDGSGLFKSIELLDPYQRKLRIVISSGEHVEINCQKYGSTSGSGRYYYTANWEGVIITDELDADAIMISTSKSNSGSTQYETRHYYIRER